MNCIFCKIIAKEIPSDVVLEDADWVAIRDRNPQAPHHVLVMPRRHEPGLPAYGAGDSSHLGGLLLAAAKVARHLGEEGRGYRVVVNSGEYGGQTVGHLHLHVLAGRGMNWPPG